MDIIACTPLKVKGQKEKALFIINKAPAQMQSFHKTKKLIRKDKTNLHELNFQTNAKKKPCS